MTSFQRTQIYLEPDQHRKLSEQAAARGTSLAALLRELVAAHLRGGAVGGSKTFEAITGIVDLDAPTDIVGDWDSEMSKAMGSRYQKKAGTAKQKRRAKR
jgi:hypothetical protein